MTIVAHDASRGQELCQVHASPRRTHARSGLRLAAACALVAVLGGLLPAVASVGPGVELWVSRYDGPSGPPYDGDGARAMGLSPDGSIVFVTGASAGTDGNTEYATVAYEAVTGAELWARRYPGTVNALGVNPDGSAVYVTGTSPGPGSYYDYATVAYDAVTGARLWARRYNGTGNYYDNAYALGVSPDGGAVYVTGTSAGTSGSGRVRVGDPARSHEDAPNDYATVAYDAATGSRLWVRRYDGLGKDFDGAKALGVSPDGSTVFVTGASSGGSQGWNFATIAYDASTGDQLWTGIYDASSNIDSALALAVNPDGSAVYVTGESDGADTGDDYSTVAYDAATGARLWGKRYSSPGRSFDVGEAIGVSPDGGTVVVNGVYDYELGTVAYDSATGSKLWTRRYAGRGGFEVQFTPDGSAVLVIGSKAGPRGRGDFVLLAYDPSTGTTLWKLRYAGPGHAVARTLRISPDGTRLFVTGYSGRSRTGTDYKTVAYPLDGGSSLYLSDWHPRVEELVDRVSGGGRRGVRSHWTATGYERRGPETVCRGDASHVA